MKEGAFKEAMETAGKNGSSFWTPKMAGKVLQGWETAIADAKVATYAAAWYLRSLQDRLPDTFNPYYSQEELVRVGYQTSAKNMLCMAGQNRPMEHVSGGSADMVQALDGAWGEANRLICTGYFDC
ncbi:hypothetical protein Drose_15310 [Dactylosporangium roseum]|uniref:Uncharacterized protein n=1 Tax=Dactylosporangium roseum TaxID=47989 RepID=A0ABY5ZEU8_9ACTN|nr:hypothetical protein [Dactylosporangium roseum]UWZ39480.1 hypothetical protein Drose_15310 [Dactylosporangium roseum]